MSTNRYAIPVVVEAKDADSAWEEMGQFATGTYDEFTFQFLGDPFPIVTKDEYDSKEAALAILRGASKAHPTPEAGDMSRSDGLGADPEEKRRKARMADRVQFLKDRGWDVSALDYERGEIDLPELLRRVHHDPDTVHQISAWLEEDAADEVQTLDEIAKVMRSVEAWTDPECGDLIAEKLIAVGRDPEPNKLTPGQRTACEMADECGYKDLPEPGEDDGGVDALIAYKDACEDRMVELIDARERALQTFSHGSRHRYTGQEAADILRAVMC